MGRMSELHAEILSRSESGGSVSEIAASLEIPLSWVTNAITTASIDEASHQEDGLETWWDAARNCRTQRCKCWARVGGYTTDNGWAPVNIPYPHAPVCDHCLDQD